MQTLPSLPLVSELQARADDFQHLLNNTKIPATIAKKLRPNLAADELFSSQDSRIFVRARPIIPFDNENMDNVGMVQKIDGARDLVLMSPKLSLAGQTSLEAYVVNLDGVFVGQVDNSQRVYVQSCFPLVAFAVDGASTCIICYGQTGSGKTYTTTGIFQFVAQDLTSFFATHTITLTVLQIQSRRNIDLLTGAQVQIVQDVSGQLKMLGTQPLECQDSDMLLAAFEEAASLRTTKATGRNETSSRTHMIARVSIVSKQTKWAKPGELFIVDLAGSENTADSATHDKERNNETKFINTSLMTLKDCIRARALASGSSKHLHIPYRRSPLTLLLRDCFELAVRRPTKTVVIACVSPLLRDARHTVNTLRYASLLAITPPARVIEADPDDPNGFTREQALQFLTTISKGSIDTPQAVLIEGDGRTLVHIPEAQFIRRTLDSHPHIGEKKAKMIYTAIWKRIVDARTKGRKVMTAAKPIARGPRCAN